MTQRNYFPLPNQLKDSDKLVLFHERQVLVRGENFVWSRSELALALPEDVELLLIDEFEGEAVIAVNVKQDVSAALGAEIRPLRSLLLADSEAVLAQAGKANQVLDWYSSHRYCGACGCATVQHPEQRAVVCPRCERQYFPRINPCVIMLIVRGRQILLARSARFKSGFFSCLAGFIEVGETPEQTVAREVREEVGVEVSNIRYAKSQSWPFPSQLMLGFYADYESGVIVPEEAEIAEAAWFDIDNLPAVPSAEISVAGELIRDYVRLMQAANFEN